MKFYNKLIALILILIIFFIAFLFWNKKERDFFSNHYPKIIAHRGASGYEPENTLRSFKKAMELGVDIIELDVHKCKSGELVVIHDFNLNRTTNGKGLVKDKTLAELRELELKKSEKIPTL